MVELSDKSNEYDLEITERFLYLRNRLKNGMGTLAKKILADFLCDENLDTKTRINIAFKIYDRFHKEDAKEDVYDDSIEKPSILSLLQQGLVKIECDDDTEL